MSIFIILILLCLVAGYLSYRFSGWLFPRKGKEENINNASEVITSRVLSAIFLGVLPLIAIKFLGLSAPGLGIASGKPIGSVYGVLIGLILVAVNFFIASTPGNLRDFPYIRNREWTFMLVISSSLTWAIYLLAYEAMFRGFLLFSLTDMAGKWVAITINTLLYFLVHLHRGWKEAAGSVPFGVLLCIICLDSGSFVPGFIAHVMLALPNEWLSLRAHPEMRIVKRMF